MGVVPGFAPWAVYWVLMGNTPPLVAAALALGVAVAVLVSSREPETRVLAIGAVATFGVLAVLFHGTQPWALPVSFAGLFAAVLIGVVIGRSVPQAFATAELPAAVVQTELFAPVVSRLTWIWLGALAAMTVSAALPSILRPGAGTPQAYLCSWVVPFTILAAAAITSRVLADRMTAGFGDAVRKTSFVAFVDLEIDQLYYLAQEHANREVGPGEEAYNVTVGAKGTPLLGDDTRVSWPSTYNVRRGRD